MLPLVTLLTPVTLTASTPVFTPTSPPLTTLASGELIIPSEANSNGSMIEDVQAVDPIFDFAQAHGSDIEIQPFETATYAVRIFRPRGEVPPYMNLFNKETGTLILNKVIIYEEGGGHEPRLITYRDRTLTVEVIDSPNNHRRELRITQNGIQTTEFEQQPPISATRVAFQTTTHAVRIFQREGSPQLYMNVYNLAENRLELDSMAVSQRGNQTADGPIEYRAMPSQGVHYVVTGNERYQLAIIYPETSP